MAELEALGHPAAAGDPELLERLGWTRPYTSRVLANLEAHRLLRSFPGPTTGQGRPPKLYEPEPKSVMLEQIARHRVFASVTAIEDSPASTCPATSSPASRATSDPRHS